MASTAGALRGYLEYLRDLGIYDLYRSRFAESDVTAALVALLPPAAVEQPSAQTPSGGSARISPVSAAAAMPRAVVRERPNRSASKGLSIVITPAEQSGTASHTASVYGADEPGPDTAADAALSETGRFAAPAMPLVSFNDRAPLPLQRTQSTEKATQLQALRVEIGDCTRCPLAYAGRHAVVFADGDPNAELMFVGEGPGADEDSSGVPFVGKAGQLLNNMISAMGLRREQVYIANIVMCRPPKNRVPEPAEANTCAPFLLRQMDIVQPKVVVALGSTAATYLLGTKQSLSALRGRWHDVRGAKCVVTYHPAYLLRDPRMKAEAWNDLQRVMAELHLKPGART